jgi:hypothetical protein
VIYVTRNGRMFEVFAEDLRPNYGLGRADDRGSPMADAGALLCETALRDVVSEETIFATGRSVAAYKPILGVG